MLEKNLSQLPVVDSDGKLIGIISMESILKAQQFFNVSFDDLCVSHAAKTCGDEFCCTEDNELSRGW
jgi:predicted transcriptional regulator